MKRILMPACILMAVLIVVISMTTISFSWFQPKDYTGSNLRFNENVPTRTENCVVSNFVGSIDSETKVISYSAFDSTASVNGDSVQYFRTTIKNHARFDTNVSLYLKSVVASGTNPDYMLAVTVPTNTCRTFTSTQSDLHVVRNACVTAYNAEKASTGEIIIDWFIKVNSGTVSIDSDDIYIAYN